MLILSKLSNKEVLKIIKVIVGIGVIVLLSLKELLASKSKGKLMTMYFILIGISLVLGILLSIDKPPASPIKVLLDALEGMREAHE